jgi:heterotetrameric sarcosine oxidase delta subunit
MLLINCPWCGDRAETEFSYGGEGGIQRPLDPDALSDAEWADYLFNRSNPRGAHRELRVVVAGLASIATPCPTPSSAAMHCLPPSSPGSRREPCSQDASIKADA